MQCMKCSKPLLGSGVCSCGFDWRETAVSFVAPLSNAQIQELLSSLDTKERLELRARRGDLQAQVRLGSMYLKGEEVPKSEQEAAGWLCLAAEQGDTFSQSWMGTFYRDGRGGVEKNYAEAAKWFCLAAKQGDKYSQRELGKLYTDGKYIEKDEAEAAKWFRLAAEQGDVLSQSWMGTFYRDGRGGVAQNHAEAAKWFRKAADRGDRFSQKELGKLYLTERATASEQEKVFSFTTLNFPDIEKNDIEAAKWFLLAAEQGDSYSQNQMGAMYRDGRGVEKNATEAAKWYRLAAEQGDSYSQAMIGDFYRDGYGVSQNREEAKKWYRMAAENGEPSALHWLGVFDFMKKEGIQDLNTAHKIYTLRSKAEQGETHAMYQLGCLLINPKSKASCEEAKKWLQMAMEHGMDDARSKLNDVRRILADMYRYG